MSKGHRRYTEARDRKGLGCHVAPTCTYRTKCGRGLPSCAENRVTGARLDKVFAHSAYAGLDPSITEPPSTYVPGRVYGCFFDDDTGIANRDAIGITQMVFEVDYPHQDTTWPHTHQIVEKMAKQLDDYELERVVRLNALDMLGLH